MEPFVLEAGVNARKETSKPVVEEPGRKDAPLKQVQACRESPLHLAEACLTGLDSTFAASDPKALPSGQISATNSGSKVSILGLGWTPIQYFDRSPCYPDALPGQEAALDRDYNRLFNSPDSPSTWARHDGQIILSASDVDARHGGRSSRRRKADRGPLLSGNIAPLPGEGEVGAFCGDPSPSSLLDSFQSIEDRSMLLRSEDSDTLVLSIRDLSIRAADALKSDSDHRKVADEQFYQALRSLEQLQRLEGNKADNPEAWQQSSGEDRSASSGSLQQVSEGVISQDTVVDQVRTRIPKLERSEVATGVNKAEKAGIRQRLGRFNPGLTRTMKDTTREPPTVRERFNLRPGGAGCAELVSPSRSSLFEDDPAGRRAPSNALWDHTHSRIASAPSGREKLFQSGRANDLCTSFKGLGVPITLATIPQKPSRRRGSVRDQVMKTHSDFRSSVREAGDMGEGLGNPVKGKAAGSGAGRTDFLSSGLRRTLAEPSPFGEIFGKLPSTNEASPGRRSSFRGGPLSRMQPLRARKRLSEPISSRRTGDSKS
jgi:hypothetical protein